MNLEMLYKAINNHLTDSQTVVQRDSFADGWWLSLEQGQSPWTQMNRLSPKPKLLPYHKLLQPYILQKQTPPRRAQGASKGQRVLSSPQKSAVSPGVFLVLSVPVPWQSSCKCSYGTVALLMLFSAKAAKWEEWYQKWHMVHLYCALSFIHSK